MNRMQNFSSNLNIKYLAISFTIVTIILAILTILFTSFILYRLISFIKYRQERLSKSQSRRIGLLHSVNTYIHILGGVIIFFVMSTRTFYGDLFLKEFYLTNSSPSWHCRLVNYFMSMFASGIYGSCFLQALFRYWRIMYPYKRIYRKYSFHLRLILFHWILTLILSIPVWFRSVYILGENFCLNRFTDTYSSIYISTIAVVIPVTSITFVYIKIIFFLKYHWQTRKRWRRMKRDILIIKRILLLVFVLLNVSTAAIILWLLMFIQQRLHPLSYRILCLISTLGMTIFSLTLLIVSPPLKRALIHSIV